jgi:hypothetical protein
MSAVQKRALLDKTESCSNWELDWGTAQQERWKKKKRVGEEIDQHFCRGAKASEV